MNRFAILLAAGVSALALTSAAQAADLIIDTPAPAGVVDAGGDWEGAFIGVFGGMGWGDYAEDGGYTMDVSGWLIGADIGYNFYLSDGIVAGIVGDIAWSDIGGVDGGYAVDVDWSGSVRGRLGIDAGAFMPYLTGGVAFTGVTADATGNAGTTDSNIHVGWTVGAGVEIAATEDLSIDLQYRYSDYGSQTYNVGFGDYDVTLTTHQVTAGLHWNF